MALCAAHASSPRPFERRRATAIKKNIRNEIWRRPHVKWYGRACLCVVAMRVNVISLVGGISAATQNLVKIIAHASIEEKWIRCEENARANDLQQKQKWPCTAIKWKASKEQTEFKIWLLWRPTTDMSIVQSTSTLRSAFPMILLKKNVPHSPSSSIQ